MVTVKTSAKTVPTTPVGLDLRGIYTAIYRLRLMAIAQRRVAFLKARLARKAI